MNVLPFGGIVQPGRKTWSQCYEELQQSEAVTKRGIGSFFQTNWVIERESWILRDRQ